MHLLGSLSVRPYVILFQCDVCRGGPRDVQRMMTRSTGQLEHQEEKRVLESDSDSEGECAEKRDVQKAVEESLALMHTRARDNEGRGMSIWEGKDDDGDDDGQDEVDSADDTEDELPEGPPKVMNRRGEASMNVVSGVKEGDGDGGLELFGVNEGDSITLFACQREQVGTRLNEIEAGVGKVASVMIRLYGGAQEHKVPSFDEMELGEGKMGDDAGEGEMGDVADEGEMEDDVGEGKMEDDEVTALKAKLKSMEEELKGLYSALRGRDGEGISSMVLSPVCAHMAASIAYELYIVQRRLCDMTGPIVQLKRLALVFLRSADDHVRHVWEEQEVLRREEEDDNMEDRKSEMEYKVARSKLDVI